MASKSTDHAILPHRLARIDGLRALAALAVLFIHSSIITDNAWITPLFGAGFIGVHLFFLISGYVIYLAWDKAGDDSLPAFYIRRFFRVAPLYYVLLILTYIMKWSNNTNDLDLANALWHATVLHGFSAHYRLVGIGAMWSLTSELIFYLAFPFLVFLRTRTLVIIFVLSVAFLNNTNEIAQKFLHMQFLALEPLETIKFFVGGMLIYRYRDILSRDSILLISEVMAWLFVGALAMVTVYNALDHAGVPHLASILKEGKNVFAMHEYFLIFAFPYLMFSPSKRMTAIFDNRIAKYLGTISYSIYLWQMPVVYEMLPGRLIFPISQLVFFLIVIGVASISYFVIERPFIALGRGLSDDPGQIMRAAFQFRDGVQSLPIRVLRRFW